MKRLHTKTLFLYAIVLFTSTCFTFAQLPALYVDGNEIKDPAGNKVVLRGVSIEHIDHQAQSSIGINGLTDLLINENDDASNSPGWYTKIIRFPVDAHNYNNAPDVYFDTYIEPAVEYATNQGLYIIIDWHYVDDVQAHDQATKDFWAKVAPAFKDYGNVWYELYNEPKLALNWAQLKPYYQGWYDVVRQHAPDNIVLVGSQSWCQYPDDAADNPLQGTNIAYVAHAYANHWPWIENKITYAASKVPVVMTEWGFREGLNWDPTGGDEEDVATFGEPMMNMLDQHGIHWTAWCASEDYEPAMFYPGWALRTGNDEMGGFIKDALYTRRNDDQPVSDPGPYTLTVLDDGLGSATIDPIKALYPKGDIVTLTATPNPGASFTHWSGGVSGTDITTTITMTGNKTVTANFMEPYDVPAQIEAEDFHNQEGLQTENTDDIGGGQNVGWTSDSDWMSFEVDFESTSTYKIDYRVAANVPEGGQFKLLLDEQVIETIDIASTGDWQNWITVNGDNFTATSGPHTLTLEVTQGGFNINYFVVNGVIGATNKKIEVLGHVYPNPTKEQLHFMGQDDIEDIQLCNALGQIVAQYVSFPMFVGDVPPGQYVLLLTSSTGTIQRELIRID